MFNTTRPSLKLKLSLNYVIALALIIWIGFSLHELAHYFLIVGQGGELYAAFNMWSWTSDVEFSAAQIIAFLAAGPVVSYGLMWIGAGLLRLTQRYQLLGFSMIVAGLPLMRLTGQSGILSGDERWIAQTLGISHYWVLLVVLLIALPPMIVAYRAIQNERPLLWFLGFFVLAPILLMIFALLPDYIYLKPLVDSSYVARSPQLPMILGVPLVVLLADAVVLALFFGYFKRFLIRQDEGKTHNATIRDKGATYMR